MIQAEPWWFVNEFQGKRKICKLWFSVRFSSLKKKKFIGKCLLRQKRQLNTVEILSWKKDGEEKEKNLSQEGLQKVRGDPDRIVESEISNLRIIWKKKKNEKVIWFKSSEAFYGKTNKSSTAETFFFFSIERSRNRIKKGKKMKTFFFFKSSNEGWQRRSKKENFYMYL